MIRRAEQRDIPGILELLVQVDMVTTTAAPICSGGRRPNTAQRSLQRSSAMRKRLSLFTPMKRIPVCSAMPSA